MIRLLLGGSPCTYWSIAQKNNRETEASGIGWELFKNYLIAKEKFKPDYFLYENNVSAAQPIKDEIKKQLGVWDGTFLTPYSDVRYIEINSALVSAQNRERFYVHNCGEVGQPKDKGILLKDILETGLTDKDKAYCLKHQAGNARDYFKKHHTQVAFEPIPIQTAVNGKAHTIKAQYYKNGIANFITNDGFNATAVAEPVRVGTMPQSDGTVRESKQWRIYDIDGKSTALYGNGGGGGANTGLYAVPHMRVRENTAKGYIDIAPGECVNLAQINSKTRRGRAMREKSNCLLTSNEFYQYCGTKYCPVYEVKDGKITIKGKEYPIKLLDGFYIIRKLTVAECRRLQTIPDWYKMPCSDTQNYKMLGNGWTVEVIKHILSHIPGITTEPIEVLSMYDGMGCGQIALKELGANVVRYYATEIDKYAIQTTQENFPATIQLGDAFQVRNDDWETKINKIGELRK